VSSAAFTSKLDVSWLFFGEVHSLLTCCHHVPPWKDRHIGKGAGGGGL